MPEKRPGLILLWYHLSRNNVSNLINSPTPTDNLYFIAHTYCPNCNVERACCTFKRNINCNKVAIILSYIVRSYLNVSMYVYIVSLMNEVISQNADDTWSVRAKCKIFIQSFNCDRITHCLRAQIFIYINNLHCQILLPSQN